MAVYSRKRNGFIGLKLMDNFSSFGKYFIILGIIITIVGVIIYLSGKLPFIGRLPGDIYIKRDNFTFYFPLVTSIVISIILTIILNIFFRK